MAAWNDDAMLESNATGISEISDCSTGKVRPYMMDSSTEDDYNNGVCKSCGVPCIEDT